MASSFSLGLVNHCLKCIQHLKFQLFSIFNGIQLQYKPGQSLSHIYSATTKFNFNLYILNGFQPGQPGQPLSKIYSAIKISIVFNFSMASSYSLNLVSHYLTNILHTMNSCAWIRVVGTLKLSQLIDIPVLKMYDF